MVALLALAFAAAPVADRVRLVPPLALLNVAEARAWDLADPREAVEDILRTASVLEPSGAARRVRAASERLAKLPPPPNNWLGRQGGQARIAVLVAPHDRALRDEILRRAVTEADAALALPELWTVPTVRPLAEGNPQRELDTYKLLLALKRRLWDTVASRPAGPGPLQALFADARAAGTANWGCISSRFESDLRLELAGLDPESLPAVPPLEADRRSQASACGHLAADRWRDGRRDHFTGRLARYAAETGAGLQEVFEVLKHYDLDAAWALAQKLPAEGDSTVQRAPILHSLIVAVAWRDPERALELAELEPGDEWVSAVARVWAYKRPEQIERAIETLRHEYTRNQLRGEAADELAWRAAGHLPRDSPRAVPPFPGGSARPATPAELRARGVPRGSPEEIRVLDNPADTKWLTGHHRQTWLRQAASLSYRETGGYAGIDAILAGLSDPAEIDDVLCHAAEFSPPAEAAKLLARVKSGRRYVASACVAARKVGEGVLRSE